MTTILCGRCRRWVVFVPGVTASLLPALLLTNVFAQSGHHASTLFAFWIELLIGPVKYWLPVLVGTPSPYALHPMPGNSTWVYLVCLPLTFSHPVKPRLLTGWMTVMAFAVWYGWAFLALLAFEY